MRGLTLLLALIALPGCGLALADVDGGLSNQCSATSECGPAATCSDNQCISTSSDLAGLVLLFDIPATSRFAPASSIAFSASDLGLEVEGDDPNGYSLSPSVVIPALVETTASLTVSPLTEACAPLVNESNQFPASFEFYPRSDIIGLPLGSYALDTSGADVETPSVMLPPGRYDIYIVPQLPADSDEPCFLPPTLLYAQNIEGGQIEVDVNLGQSQSVSGKIEGLDIDGWTLDIVDNTNGRLISTSQSLSGNAATFDLLAYEDLLKGEASDALLRLSPSTEAQSAGMPVVLWNISAIDLSGSYQELALDLKDLASSPVQTISGQVVEMNTSVAVSGATVSIQSDKLLDGNFGPNAAYKTHVTTDETGGFSVSLLPGDYTVTASPSGNPDYSVTTATWTISTDDLGGGRTIELLPKAIVNGSVSTPQGASAAQVNCQLRPTVTRGLTYLEDVLLTTSSPPHATSTSTNNNGGFAIESDHGDYDFTLQPSSSSGYPWRLVPRLSITENMALGVQRLAAPVRIQALIRTPNGEIIAGASARAWLPAPVSTTNVAPSAIQIGEAIANANGSFELLLPPSLSP